MEQKALTRRAFQQETKTFTLCEIPLGIIAVPQTPTPGYLYSAGRCLSGMRHTTAQPAVLTAKQVAGTGIKITGDQIVILYD